MTRDEEHAAVLEALAALWAQHPEQRLTQLLINATRYEEGPVHPVSLLWHYPDTQLLAALKDGL